MDLSNVAAQGREADITIPDPRGSVEIENDDEATVDIQSVVSVNEDDGTADLLVTLSAPVDVEVKVGADHQDGTATEAGATAADDDYEAVDANLTFGNLVIDTQQFTVTVPITVDGIVELDEVMQVVLGTGGDAGTAVFNVDGGTGWLGIRNGLNDRQAMAAYGRIDRDVFLCDGVCFGHRGGGAGFYWQRPQYGGHTIQSPAQVDCRRARRAQRGESVDEAGVTGICRHSNSKAVSSCGTDQRRATHLHRFNGMGGGGHV